VVIWSAIAGYSAVPIITLMVKLLPVTVDILGNRVHPMVHMVFRNIDSIFEDDNSPIHIARTVKSWFAEHEDALQLVPWPAQTPVLYIYHRITMVSLKEQREKQNPSSFIS
jgi:hypothetical protein